MPAEQPTPAAHPRGLAALIRSLAARAGSGAAVTLGDALDPSGARVHGAAILILALPDALPLPIPSIGAVLGVPLFLIWLHLAIFGDRGTLPDRVRRVTLPPRMLALMDRYLARWLERAERLSQDRLPFLAGRERLVGAACSLMSLLLLMPVPLMNVPPSLALVCLSWGLLQRDGLIVAVGLAMAAGTVVIVIVLAELVGATLSRALG